MIICNTGKYELATVSNFNVLPMVKIRSRPPAASPQIKSNMQSMCPPSKSKFLFYKPPRNTDNLTCITSGLSWLGSGPSKIHPKAITAASLYRQSGFLMCSLINGST